MNDAGRTLVSIGFGAKHTIEVDKIEESVRIRVYFLSIDER